MKMMKKISALTLALAMIIGMIAPMALYADDEVQLSINGVAGHTYKVYQIFTGSLNDVGVLTDIEWGSGISDDYKETPLDAEGNPLQNAGESMTASEVAAYLDGNNIKAMATVFGSNLTDVSVELDSNYSVQVLPGYYLIKDVDVPVGEQGTEYIVSISKDTNISPKIGNIKFEKKIMDVNDSTESQLGDEKTNPASDKWKDSADYDIGDTVPFKLSATIAANADQYQAPYKLVFHDQLSPQLTPVLDDNDKLVVVVKVNNTLVESGYEVSDVVVGSDGSQSFSVTIKNIDDIDANPLDTVHVFLSATLNDDAEIGQTTENLNMAKLQYSNNPTYVEDPGNPNEDGTTETEWDVVRVFTYKYVIDKVDENNAPLEGAGFTLEKKDSDGKYKLYKTISPASGKTEFEFIGLDDGEYRIIESTTPSGYNTIEPFYLIITAEHDEDEVVVNDPRLRTVTFTKKDEAGNILDTDEQEAYYEDSRSAIVVGEYYDTVVNQAGVVLPSTGGMGTTILYIVGGMLAIGAGVLLVTRKIMVSNK